MDDGRIMARLEELGEELPPPPQAIASYVPVVRFGSMAFVSGQVALVDGAPLHPGTLGVDVTVEEGAAAARRAALQALSALRGELGTFDQLRRILKLSVFVASVQDFEAHPQVANGASDFLIEVLGEEGRHARAAVGTASLPLRSSVELEMIVELEPSPSS
jgi:enamine deaminase RidA (YjgF/YER057c/UK114 family)